MAEHLFSDGQQVVDDNTDTPRLYYILTGQGRFTFEGEKSITIRPHTFIIIPTKQCVDVEVIRTDLVDEVAQARMLPEELDRRKPIRGKSAVEDHKAELTLIRGYFKAEHGYAIEPFARLVSPVVEQFEAGDHIDSKLKEVMTELGRQEFGADAMVAALMKQVFVTLFRRALASTSVWVEQFTAINDEHVSRAFADMITRPSASHSLRSLSQTAGLSRSAFIDRFSTLFGRSPMAVLRDLRMRQAALLLPSHQVDQVAHMVGYANRSSFCRAFQKYHGDHPSRFKAREQAPRRADH